MSTTTLAMPTRTHLKLGDFPAILCNVIPATFEDADKFQELETLELRQLASSTNYDVRVLLCGTQADTRSYVAESARQPECREGAD